MSLSDAETIVPNPSSPSGPTSASSELHNAGVLALGAMVGRYVVLDELGAGAMGHVY